MPPAIARFAHFALSSRYWRNVVVAAWLAALFVAPHFAIPLLIGGINPLASGPGTGPWWTQDLPVGVGPSRVLDVMQFGQARGTGTIDDGQQIQTTENAAGLIGGAVFFPPSPSGSYLVNTSVTPKSNVFHFAYPRTVILKRTVVGNVFDKTGVGQLSGASWSGLDFDCTGVGWSALALFGSDAGGQLVDLTVRDCRFKNPSSTWMIMFNYTIADPVVPASKNRNIRFEDCTDDASGQTFNLENLIFVNCQDVAVTNNRFLNATAAMAAHVAVYGYNRNIRFVSNYAENWAASYAYYVIQSDTVHFVGDNFRTTGSLTCVQVFNSRDVSVLGGTMVTALNGSGAYIHDFSGATFDGHTNLYSSTAGVQIKDVRLDAMFAGVTLDLDQVQGQADISIEDCMASPNRSLFYIKNMPAAPSAAVKRITIIDNHVISHNGVAGVGCVEIAGNNAAVNGGIQTVIIIGNAFAQGSGGSNVDIDVSTLADDITITRNKHTGSAAPISIAANATNVNCWDNAMTGGTAPIPTTGTLGANVTSVTPTGNNHHGSMAVVMAGALAANTRICTVTFASSPFGATPPRIHLINQTAGAGLANVAFYVQAQGTGQTFDLACDQALAAGTYTAAYDVMPAGVN